MAASINQVFPLELKLECACPLLFLCRNIEGRCLLSGAAFKFHSTKLCSSTRPLELKPGSPEAVGRSVFMNLNMKSACDGAAPTRNQEGFELSWSPGATSHQMTGGIWAMVAHIPNYKLQVGGSWTYKPQLPWGLRSKPQERGYLLSRGLLAGCPLGSRLGGASNFPLRGGKCSIWVRASVEAGGGFGWKDIRVALILPLSLRLGTLIVDRGFKKRNCVYKVKSLVA